MKTLKAYTFEELLCEIPELEKYKHAPLNLMDKDIQKLMIRFGRANKLNAFYPDILVFENTPHILFEKL